MLIKHTITTYKDVVMLGKVFKQYGVNLIYGESGIGKTVSSIKALNTDGIVPVLLDFDDNESPETNDCKYIHINGVTAVADTEATIPTEQVIIVDTWASYISASPYGDKMAYLNKLVSHNNTIVIVAHNKGIATKTDIPDIDEVIVNHLSSKLWLERRKATTKHPELCSTLHIYKCRGYTGARSIDNWMR